MSAPGGSASAGPSPYTRSQAAETAKFKSHMHSLAFGEAMLAAAGDYKKGMEAQQKAQLDAMKAHRTIDMQDFANDPDLEKLYEQRMALYRRQLEEKQKMSLKGHGQLTEVRRGPGGAPAPRPAPRVVGPPPPPTPPSPPPRRPVRGRPCRPGPGPARYAPPPRPPPACRLRRRSSSRR